MAKTPHICTGWYSGGGTGWYNSHRLSNRSSSPIELGIDHNTPLSSNSASELEKGILNQWTSVKVDMSGWIEADKKPFNLYEVWHMMQVRTNAYSRAIEANKKKTGSLSELMIDQMDTFLDATYRMIESKLGSSFHNSFYRILKEKYESIKQ